MSLRVFRVQLLVPLCLSLHLQAPQCSLSLQIPAPLALRLASLPVTQLPLLPRHQFLDSYQQVPQHHLPSGSSPPVPCPLPPLPRRLPARGLVLLLLAPPLLGALVSRPLGKHQLSGNQQAVLPVVSPLASLDLGQCLPLVSRRLPLQPRAVAVCSEHRLAPTVRAPFPSDSHPPAPGVGCLDKPALRCLGRAAPLGKGALSLVAPPPLPLLHHLLGSASAKLQALVQATQVLYLGKQLILEALSLASHLLPVEACLELEMVGEVGVSSVVWEESQARMQPIRILSVPPVEDLDLQLPRILLAYLETVEPRPLDLAAHLLGSRSLRALSALVEEAWHLKALGSLVQPKQVASVLLQCLAALPLLGDPLGLEGCQHSVQPQPFQALWARREAKCSARVQQQPALEDLGLVVPVAIQHHLAR